MNTIKVAIKSDEKASRMELLVRFVWGTICFIVLWFVGIFAGFAFVIQWLHILFTGKRHPSIQKFVNSYETAKAQLYMYMMLCTDERPPIMPEF